MTEKTKCDPYQFSYPAPPQEAVGDCYLPACKVWRRYGVTSMTLWRWLQNERLGFPKPTYFGRCRYWRLSDLLAWERACARGRCGDV